MANIPDFGASAAYIGFWIDHDVGRFLTLSNRDATAFLSFLAIAVTFAGNRSWNIIRFILFQLLRLGHGNQKQPTKLTQKLRAILRNAVTAGIALWTVVELLWNHGQGLDPAKRYKELFSSARGIKRLPWKVIALALISAAHLAATISAGILTSRIFVGRTVVSRAIDSCGEWQAKNATFLDNKPLEVQNTDIAVWQSLRMNETIDADNYVRNCYPIGVSQGVLDCDKLFTRALPYKLEHDVPCPFGDDICSDRPNDAFVMDSGPITLRDLGINSKFARSLSVQRRSVCAVVPDEPFLDEDDESVRSYRFFNGPYEDVGEGIFYRKENISATFNLQAYYLPLDAHKIAKPIRPDILDHDPSIILLRSNGVYFYTTHDDPWFSVKTRTEFKNSSGGLPADFIRYNTDNFLNVIACKEATRFCSTLSGSCSAWGGLISPFSNLETIFPVLAGSYFQNDASDIEEFINVYTLVANWLSYTSIPSSIYGRSATSALQAGRYFKDKTQMHLEPEQWKIELEYWFAMGMARLQLAILNTIEKPPSVDENSAINTWEGTGLKNLCGRVKLRSPNHMTLDTVGIVIVLSLVGFLTLGSLLDVVIGWIPTPWAQGVVKKWEKMDYLHLLEEIERLQDEVA